MPHSSHPIGGDLADFLAAAGLSLSDALLLRLDGVMLRAVADFARATGRTMPAATATRTFDPPSNARGVLDLRADLASLDGVFVTVQGRAQTLGTDVRFLGEDGTGNQAPFTHAQFRVRGWSGAITGDGWGCIGITGPWGYAVEVPDDVWEAELARGAWLCYPQLAQGLSGGLANWARANVQEQYGARPLDFLRSAWGGDDPQGNGGQYGDAVLRYSRWA